MTELSSRNLTDTRGDPAETHGLDEESVSGPDAATPQDVQALLGPKMFTAVLLDKTLRRSPTSLRRDPSSWLEKTDEDRGLLLDQSYRSRNYWAGQELAAFIAKEKPKYSEIGEAARHLSDEAFGARLLTTKVGQSHVGWLALPIDERKAALEIFKERHQEWKRVELDGHAARAGKGAAVKPVASASAEVAEKSRPTRTLAVRSLLHTRKKTASRKGPAHKARSSGKGSGSDNTR